VTKQAKLVPVVVQELFHHRHLSATSV
jgi:hypothetical protein